MVEKLLTPEEAAELMGVNADTVRNWLRRGTLKGVKLGGRIWRIKEKDLEAFIDNKSE